MSIPSSPRLLRVANWDSLYENNRTRGLQVMQWVPIPNKHDGDGYTDLTDHPNAAAHVGVWLVTLQVASKCKPRGTLVRDNGTPHTAVTLGRVTRLPPEVFVEAIPRLIEIGWLEVAPNERDSTTVREDGTRVRESGTTLRVTDYEGNGREWKGREWKGRK
jgi:hypothetical protein